MPGDEQQMTELYEEPTWATPVASVQDLPAPSDTIAEGTLCFVEAERTVYWFRGGAWVSRANRGD